MIWAALVPTILACAVAFAAVVGPRRNGHRPHQPPGPVAPGGWWASMVCQQVMVHMVDDNTIRGVVRHVGGDGVLLACCEFLGANNSLPLGGEVWIDRTKIAFTQIPPPPVAAKP